VGAFATIFRELAQADAGYVVVGGLAVVLHGYARVTADIDLVVDLRAPDAIRAVAALSRLGMLPRAPVEARAFADATERQRWIDEKGMRVFSMYDPRRPLIEVDLFVNPPISFEKLRANAVLMTIEEVQVPVACIADLIAMKRIAARPKDMEDIAALEAIDERRKK